MNNNLAENIIEVKNVKKIYRMGKERICAVDDVSFTIKRGEFCCLYGVSGSGKSTLLNLMAGIEKLTAGQIIIKGKNIHRMNERRLAKFRQNNLGFVFQSYNLMNAMTALENVELPLIFKRYSTKKRKKMARDMLIKVGLGARLKHKPKEMSGGQQQRVGIARAFVSKPEIVFADEPTGNLDSKTSKEVMDLIREIARTNRQTIVLVTHDIRLAQYADKIIHIFDGKVEKIEVRSPKEQDPNSLLQEPTLQVQEAVVPDEQSEDYNLAAEVDAVITQLQEDTSGIVQSELTAQAQPTEQAEAAEIGLTAQTDLRVQSELIDEEVS